MDDADLTALQADLLDALDSALVVTDPTGNILLWNRAAERLYGYRRDQMQGGNVMQLFVPDENATEASGIMDKVLAGQSWTGEFPVARADGSTVRVRITNSPLVREGRVVAVVGLAEVLGAEAAAPPPSTEALSDLAWALAELDGLRTAMKARGTIEQAKGVVMASLGVDDTKAFEVLRQMSQTSNRKLAEIAAEIVERASEGRVDVRGGGSR